MEFLSHYLSSLRKRKGEGGEGAFANEWNSQCRHAKKKHPDRAPLSVVFDWSAPDAGVESLSANKDCLSPPQQQQQHDQIPSSGCTGRNWLVLKTPAEAGGWRCLVPADFLSSFSPDTGGGSPRACCCCVARKRGILCGNNQLNLTTSSIFYILFLPLFYSVIYRFSIELDRTWIFYGKWTNKRSAKEDGYSAGGREKGKGYAF
jgi:hypothetical protein